MCLVIFVTQTRWYDFFDESLHVMERLRKRQSLLVSPIRGRESCLEWLWTMDRDPFSGLLERISEFLFALDGEHLRTS